MDNAPQTFDFRPLLPEDIRADPVFDVLKPKDQNEAFALLGKGYQSAQKMIGVQRLPKPQKDWKPEQWAAFNKELGVPEAADQYETPAPTNLPKGLELSPEKVTAVKTLFHSLGLRPDQATKLQNFYVQGMVDEFKQSEEKTAEARRASAAALEQEFGEKLPQKMEIAKAVIRKHGSVEFLKSIEESGLNTDPRFIKMMMSMGEALMDDVAGGGGGSGLPLGARATAVQQIEDLKIDAEFQKALNTKHHPGNKAALEKWLDLHRVAAGPAQ